MQLLLPLDKPHSTYNKYDFIISSSNIEAYNYVTQYLSWPNNRLLILGDKGCGKSHLASIWLKNQNAIDATKVTILENMEANKALLIEGIDKIKSEAYLFHAINYAFENSLSLLMTARNLPSFDIKDLASRINATHKVLIKDPDDAMLKTLLFKSFNERQLLITNEVMDYLALRIERSYASISEVVAKIDEASLRKQRSITIPFIKDILEL